MSAQGRLLGEQEQRLCELDAQINQLTNPVTQVLLACATVIPTSLLVLTSLLVRLPSVKDFWYTAHYISLVKWELQINKKIAQFLSLPIDKTL